MGMSQEHKHDARSRQSIPAHRRPHIVLLGWSGVKSQGMASMQILERFLVAQLACS